MPELPEALEDLDLSLLKGSDPCLFIEVGIAGSDDVEDTASSFTLDALEDKTGAPVDERMFCLIEGVERVSLAGI